MWVKYEISFDILGRSSQWQLDPKSFVKLAILLGRLESEVDKRKGREKERQSERARQRWKLGGLFSMETTAF